MAKVQNMRSAPASFLKPEACATYGAKNMERAVTAAEAVGEFSSEVG